MIVRAAPSPTLFAAALVLATVFSASVKAAPPPLPEGQDLVVRCGSLIDGLADEPARDVFVTIEAGRFTAIGAEAPPGRDTPACRG